MADIDLKTETPDTTLPSTGFLFGADSQASASPSVYSTQAVATTLLGSTSLTGATETTSKPLLDLSQTWNASGVTFTGMRFNVPTDSSAAGSLLMDLQVGGVSQFSARKDGRITAIGGILNDISAYGAANSNWWSGNGLNLRSASYFSINLDLFLTRRGAANLRLGAADAAAPVAQTLSVQSVVAGTTNTAGANLTITGSQGTGTGAGGSIIFQVAPAAGGSGSLQNAFATALTIDANRRLDTPVGLINSTLGSGAPWFIIDTSATFKFQFNGNERGFISSTNSTLVNGLCLHFATLNLQTATGTTTVGALLSADAANTLALRNSTNAQTFRIYNTFTDASNYERINIGFESNLAKISSTSVGGTARQLRIFGGPTASGIIQCNNGSVVVGPQLGIGIQSGDVSPVVNVYLYTPAAGVLRLTNSASNDFGLLRFGGDNSSFPALKRSSASLIVRLADDSANAALESASVKTDAPAGGTSGTWKLGVAATVSPTSPNRTIEVDIGGTIYYIAAKTTND